ncbi:anti-sigma factor domain-containing protein [Peribacillus sp. SI8-4]|uniref:anti-sigma-I factor RsgI family protein n=1 Tax=Peribacillus sp. SI8-4 TaxID=3048009 RepID=UPI00255737EF|nr:anti-sigma factor domain-containing protein [Peribacillus sp. SI8-4]
MKKGVILSVNKRFVTLLTPEGEFLKTKRDERIYEVGEEITFSPVIQKTAYTMFSFQSTFKKKAVLSIATTFLILFSILPSYFTGHVSAYMTIDVNPSIELELDDHLEVLKLTGLNEDGKLVIGQLKDWKGKGIKTVTNRIVETTKQLGYLKGQKQIVVSTTLLDKDKKLDRNLKEEIKEISEQENVSKTKMKVIQATKSDREQAKAKGISTGKYIENKLKSDQDNEKVNKRDNKQDKQPEEKKGASQKQGNIPETDPENEKVSITNDSKQKISSESKLQKPENSGTKPNQKKEKIIPDDTGNKRMESNRDQEKRKEAENQQANVRSIQKKGGNHANRNSQTIQYNRNDQSKRSFHGKQSNRDKRSNYARDERKQEKVSHEGKGRPSFQEKGEGREKDHIDHERHNQKKGNREMEKRERDNDHEENRHKWNH